jgi:hypothetical protein
MNNYQLGPNYTPAHILHDAELLSGGAEIIDSQLQATQEQIAGLYKQFGELIVGAEPKVLKLFETHDAVIDTSSTLLESQSEARQSLCEEVTTVLQPYRGLFDDRLPNSGMPTGSNKTQWLPRATKWNAYTQLGNININNQFVMSHRMVKGKSSTNEVVMEQQDVAREDRKDPDLMRLIIFYGEQSEVKALYLNANRKAQLGRMQDNLAEFYQKASVKCDLRFDFEKSTPVLDVSSPGFYYKDWSQYSYNETTQRFELMLREGEHHAKLPNYLSSSEFMILLKQTLDLIPTSQVS